jgi:LysM repeat protein
MVIQPGDTLSGIAQRSGTTVESLVEINGITNPNLILAGETLLVAPY